MGTLQSRFIAWTGRRRLAAIRAGLEELGWQVHLFADIGQLRIGRPLDAAFAALFKFESHLPVIDVAHAVLVFQLDRTRRADIVAGTAAYAGRGLLQEGRLGLLGYAPVHQADSAHAHHLLTCAHAQPADYAIVLLPVFLAKHRLFNAVFPGQFLDNRVL